MQAWFPSGEPIRGHGSCVPDLIPHWPEWGLGFISHATQNSLLHLSCFSSFSFWSNQPCIRIKLISLPSEIHLHISYPFSLYIVVFPIFINFCSFNYILESSTFKGFKGFKTLISSVNLVNNFELYVTLVLLRLVYLWTRFIISRNIFFHSTQIFFCGRRHAY